MLLPRLLLLLLSVTVSLGEVLPLANVSTIPLILGPSVPLNKDDAADGLEGLLVTKRSLDGAQIQVQENNLKGMPGQGYYISFELGTPGQKVNALIDTGSANFAVAGRSFPEVVRYFNPTASSSYTDKGTTVYVPYTQGSWQGQLGSDIAFVPFLPNGTQRFRTDVTPIQQAKGFFIPGSNWEGIVGLAFSIIARPQSNPPQPFFDSLIAASGSRLSNAFSVQLCGSSASLMARYRLAQSGRAAIALSSGVVRPSSHGSFVVGGLDMRLAAGPVLYAPLRREWYYEVVLTRLTIAGQSVIADCKELNFDKTIVDTGTTDLRLPKRVFAAVVQRLQNVVNSQPGTEVINDQFYEGRTMLCVPVGSWQWFSLFPMLEFDMQVTEKTVMRLKLSAQQYLRYVGYSSRLERDCFKFGIQSSETGTVLGSVFIEGFYTVFDRVNKRVGFSSSTCSYIGGSSANSSVTGPFAYTDSDSTSDCAFIRPSSQNFLVVEIVCIVLGILCLLIFVPIIILLLRARPRSQMSAPPSSSGTSPPPSVSSLPHLNNDRSHLLRR